jgi:hypothetical protein
MWPFKAKTLDSILFKTIKVHGVIFKIKKLDPLAFLDGSKVMLQSYDIYKVNSNKVEEQNYLKKVKEHFRDVFMYSIEYPVLKRKPEEKEGLFVDYLFTEWDLANELYSKIIEHTYGKKKILQNIWQDRTSLNSMSSATDIK